MQSQQFIFHDVDGYEIFVYQWLPEKTPVRAIIQIAHGMCESAARYERFAKALTKCGFAVYANDHRGHGKTVKSADEFGYIGQNGYNRMVQNMHQLNQIIHDQSPTLPLVLLGHSMGSFLAQTYMSMYGDTIHGVILSGTGGKQSPMIHAGIFLARREMLKKGVNAKSKILHSLTFDPYNKAFAPNRTKYDWLTRDESEVDKYIQDPLCGQIFPASFYYYFFKGLRDIHKANRLQHIPKHLPIYIFSGDKDPVGRNGKGIIQLVAMYQKVGLQNVEYKLYKNGRHEMLNEINREEVIQDILDWLENLLKNNRVD